MVVILGVFVIAFWVMASTKPAQEWAEKTIAERPVKGAKKSATLTSVVEISPGRYAIKFGEYKVGYLVERGGVWVALSLRGSEATVGATKEEAARLYIQSIGGGESNAAWVN